MTSPFSFLTRLRRGWRHLATACLRNRVRYCGAHARDGRVARPWVEAAFPPQQSHRLRWLRGATAGATHVEASRDFSCRWTPGGTRELGRLVTCRSRALASTSRARAPPESPHRGSGAWTAIDLFHGEVARWRRLDPSLTLAVCDGRMLPFRKPPSDMPCACPFLEHIAGDGDARTVDEIWRVLRPGGILHLTTNVARRAARDLGLATDPGGRHMRSATALRSSSATMARTRSRRVCCGDPGTS